MARHARKQLADMRAMAIQTERQNIIDPRDLSTEELFEEGEYVDAVTGVSGMIPPQGQVAPPRLNPSIVVGGPPGSGADVASHEMHFHGSGKHHEARQMGQRLREYLTKLHGGAYADAFAGGCGCSGAGATPTMGLSQVRGGVNKSGNVERSGSYEGLGTKKGAVRKTARRAYEGTRHPEGEAECIDRNGTFDRATGTCSVPTPFNPIPYEPGKPDVRTAPTWKPQTHYKLAEVVYVEDDANYTDNQPGYYEAKQDSTNIFLQHPGKKASSWKYLGTSYTPLQSKKVRGGSRVVGGHCPSRAHTREDIDGSGKAKKKRAPSSPSSGRSRRAEIVKKVMAEKGLKMIQASKYVKEHGLYKP